MQRWNVPRIVWEWKGEAPEKIQSMCFKTFPSPSPVCVPGYELPVKLNFSFEEVGNIFESFSQHLLISPSDRVNLQQMIKTLQKLPCNSYCLKYKQQFQLADSVQKKK